MNFQGLSWSYQKKVKNIINKVYDWGIEFQYIIGNNESPLKGLLIDRGEEKVPDILSLEEIKKFLTAANSVGHHVDRSYDSNVKKNGPTKGRYWRTIPINNSLRRLILDLKRDPVRLNSEHILPRSKDWDNGDQAVPLRNFLKSITKLNQSSSMPFVLALQLICWPTEFRPRL